MNDLTSVPMRSQNESELDYLRRKESAFGLWQADALERISSLDGDLQQAKEDCAKYRNALNHIHESLAIVGRFASLQGYEISTADFARDFAPFINIMAHHGIAPYVKPQKQRRKAA